MKPLPKAIIGAAALAIAGFLLWTAAIPARGRSAPQAQVEPPARLTSDQWPQPAPRLYGAPEDWLNTGGKALSMRRGTVYLVDFWEYTCVNCLRTLPYLKAWNDRYAKDGLVIIGIHTPEFKFAHSPKNVADAVKRLGITWPVLIDSQYKNWNAYNNDFWPRDYFVDARGNIVSDHAGEGGYGEAELQIQQLLLQIHPKLKLPAILEPLRPEDRPGARCYPMTPELYAGQRGWMQGALGNVTNFQPGMTQTFTLPAGPLNDGQIYANGVWTTEPESLRHGRETNGLTDTLVLRYHAITANSVIRPEGGKPIRVYLLQDGRPIPKADKGADVQYDVSGDSYINVTEPRMYRLTHNQVFGSHVLTLSSRSPDFGLYSFTFTSCTAP